MPMPLTQSQQQQLRAKFGDDAIVYFGGPNEFLSNFFRSPVVLDGVTYKTAEHAFQAQKAADPVARAKIVKAATPKQAKKQGRKVVRVPGWFSGVRDEAMRKALAAKFAPGSVLATRLLGTGSRPLVEGNDWDDKYWGVLPDGTGENKLGLLLQERRTQLAAPTPPPAPPPARPPVVSEPASGAAEPSPAAPGAKRRKVETEPEVLVVE